MSKRRSTLAAACGLALLTAGCGQDTGPNDNEFNEESIANVVTAYGELAIRSDPASCAYVTGDYLEFLAEGHSSCEAAWEAIRANNSDPEERNPQTDIYSIEINGNYAAVSYKWSNRGYPGALSGTAQMVKTPRGWFISDLR
jgi:hypothetical protein